MAESGFDPAANGGHPRTQFALAVVAVAVCVTGIWWLIFIGDGVLLLGLPALAIAAAWSKLKLPE